MDINVDPCWCDILTGEDTASDQSAAKTAGVCRKRKGAVWLQLLCQVTMSSVFTVILFCYIIFKETIIMMVTIFDGNIHYIVMLFLVSYFSILLMHSPHCIAIYENVVFLLLQFFQNMVYCVMTYCFVFYNCMLCREVVNTS